MNIQLAKHLKLLSGLIVFGLVAISLGITPVSAQEKSKRKFGPGQNTNPLGIRRPAPRQQPKAPPPQIMSKHGKWVVQCDARKPSNAKKPRNCAMVQVARHKTNKNVAVSLIIGRVTQGGKTATMMRVLAPIGVFLPTGIALEVDGQAVGRVPFTRCLPQVCMAFAEARKQTLAKMKKGKKAKFLIYQAPGVGIPLELDLSGFTAALDALAKVK